MPAFQIIIVVISTAFVTAVLCTVHFTRKMRKKVDYMLDALEDGETNFRFREDGFRDRRFNRALNRMKAIFRKEMEELDEREKYYGTMLDNVSTGIVVVDDNGGHVAYANCSALEMFGISSLSNLRQLGRIDPSLSEAFFKVTENHEQKASFLNEISRRTISLKSSPAVIKGKPVKIIAFNDISSEMEEKEALSWSRLIRVLTHEIMNTITPISSLSDALMNCGKDNEIDIKAGLETISSSSKGLIKFVESYRNLTHIPAPIKKVIYLKDLMSRVLNLTESQAKAEGAVCTYEELSDDIILYADEDQIAQILVNIIKNALQAEADTVRITSRIDSAESVVIDIANNGRPVSRESKDEIFVPFYTTKPSGSGLGLSISRQIMRLHNGSLMLASSTEKETVFRLVFK